MEIDHAGRLGWDHRYRGIRNKLRCPSAGFREDLEKKLDALTAQVNKSIKLDQNVTLHTQNGHPGGCLTYRGLSGDQGGIVSWNINCSHDVLWTIN